MWSGRIRIYFGKWFLPINTIQSVIGFQLHFFSYQTLERDWVRRSIRRKAVVAVCWRHAGAGPGLLWPFVCVAATVRMQVIMFSLVQPCEAAMTGNQVRKLQLYTVSFAGGEPAGLRCWQYNGVIRSGVSTMGNKNMVRTKMILHQFVICVNIFARTGELSFSKFPPSVGAMLVQSWCSCLQTDCWLHSA